MTGSISSAVLERACLDDPPERLAAGISRPVVRADQDVPAGDLEPHGVLRGADAGSTTATWTPTGMCLSANTSEPAPSRIE